MQKLAYSRPTCLPKKLIKSKHRVMAIPKVYCAVTRHSATVRVRVRVKVKVSGNGGRLEQRTQIKFLAVGTLAPKQLTFMIRAAVGGSGGNLSSFFVRRMCTAILL